MTAEKVAESAMSKLSDHRKRFGAYREKQESEVKRLSEEAKQLRAANSMKQNDEVGSLKKIRSEAYTGCNGRETEAG